MTRATECFLLFQYPQITIYPQQYTIYIHYNGQYCKLTYA